MPDTNFNSYELANYVGDLFLKGKRINATLQLMGGIGGYQEVASTEFAIGQDYSIAAHASQPAVLEGANAPDATGIVRAQATNVVQIWQETVAVTYTKEAAIRLQAGVNNGQANPVTSELDFQTAAVMEKIARQVNWVAINGTYQKPANNLTARRTRGLLAAITTNVQAAAGVNLTESHLETSLSQLIDAGAIADGDNVLVLANTVQLRKLNALYKTAFNQGQDRAVGGVRIREVYTALGVLRFALEQDLPQDTIVFANMDEVSLKGLPVPSKGVLFREPLAKTGAVERWQIYGELGVDHGLEWNHAKITGLSTTL